MGNSPSKLDTRGLPLSRSDTAGSGRSLRSIRSRISISNDAIAKSPKTLSRKNSMSSQVIDSESLSETHHIQTSTRPYGSRANLNYSISSHNSNLPPSMVQHSPKDPILMRRNTNDTSYSTSPNVSGILSRASIADGLSPASPDDSRLNSDSRSIRSLSSADLKPDTPISRTGSNTGSISRTGSNTGSLTGLLPEPILSRTTSALSAGKSSFLGSRSDRRSSTSTSLQPPQVPLTSQNEPPIDIESYIQQLLDAGYSGKRTKHVCLKSTDISIICAKAREVFLSQPPLLELSPPVKVVGDVHGQFSDLIRIFTKCGFPPSTNYLFLGDYVDRGKQSLETILLLLCYKIKYPENFFLLRGNHECANVTRVYGFYDECKRRINIRTWKLFIDTFNTLPLAAIVAGKIFCVHGGLLPVLNLLDEIRNIVRPTDVPDFGLINDLLWSDPADTVNEWEDNERGVLYVFSKVAINKFLSKFGFDLVCRAHMVVEDGYEFFNDRTLVTVFSAPNYCGEFDNWGAVMSVSEELLCSFELLDPLDGVALRQVMKKGKHERKQAQLQQQNS